MEDLGARRSSSDSRGPLKFHKTIFNSNIVEEWVVFAAYID